jgi:hypothetical protein
MGAVGRQSGIDRPEYSGSFEIVGVFRNFKMNLGYSQEKMHPEYFRPLAQQEHRSAN